MNYGFMQLKSIAECSKRVKKVSEYDQEIHNHILQTNPQHREEEPKNIYSNNTWFVRQ